MNEHDGDAETVCDLKECGCGRLTLRVGRVRLDLTREELAALHELLTVATSHLAGGSPRTGNILH